MPDRSPAGSGRLPLLLSVLLLVLAFPPLDLVVPSLVALAPLAAWIELRARGGGVAGVWRDALLFGLVLWLLLLRWLPVTLTRFLPEALPGWILVVAILGAITAAVVWTAHRLRAGAGVPVWIALPLAWTAGEWLRGNLPGSLAFPWLGLGTSLAWHPEWVGIAEIVGSRGVGLLLAATSALVGAAWVRWRVDRSGAGAARLALAAVTLALLPALWGVHRARTLETEPVLRVAVVQTAVPQEAKADPVEGARAGLEAVERLLPLVAGRADVAILPEALLPVRLTEPEAVGLRRRLERAVDRAGVPVLVGALGLERSDGVHGDAVAYNSVFLVRPGSGVAPGRYDKRQLVPVVERVPLPGWVGGDGGRWGSYGFGRSPGPMVVEGVGLGPLICLESSFPGAARSARLAGADLLVNLTNDAWLNAASPWGRTSALQQHPAHLVMRAIETRVGAARAANTGLSLFVDPTGRIHGVLPPFREGVEIRTVHSSAGETAFVRWGDVAGTGAAVGTLLLLVPGFRRSVGRGRGRPSVNGHTEGVGG